MPVRAPRWCRRTPGPSRCWPTRRASGRRPDGGALGLVSCASLRAAAHSMISSSRKNGTANITGIVHQRRQHVRECLCQVHGDTSATSLAGAPLPEAEHLTAPCGPDVQVDVVDDASCRSMIRHARSASLIRRPLRFAGQPDWAWPRRRSSASAARIRAETAAPVFRPPSLNVGVLGAGDQIAPDIGQFGGMGGADAAAAFSIGVAKSNRYR